MAVTRGIRRTLWVTALAISSLAGALAAAAMSGPTVKAAHSASYGSLLVSSNGLTLYHLTSETKGAIKCTGNCASLWPPLLVSPNAKPTAGAGVTARIGTIKRPGGKLQVTYNGFPLYRYSADKKPGDVTGEGVGGVWYVVSSDGTVVKHVPAASTSTTTTTATPTGGYGY